jgi:tetratricopeptide (TPR) repeat protein
MVRSSSGLVGCDLEAYCDHVSKEDRDMSAVDVHERVESYENLFSVADTFRREGDPLFLQMFEFYAMLAAFQLRTGLGEVEFLDGCFANSERGVDYLDASLVLPGWRTVRKAKDSLLSAFESNDKAQIAGALKEMGISSLCPILERQFRRMELFAKAMEGRARPVLCTELAVLAAEMGDYESARKYAQEAQSSELGAWEEHNLLSIEGLIALNVGNTRDAIRYLAAAIDACVFDEITSLECGVRPPNFTLASVLLVRGFRVEVIMYLSQCRDVWRIFQKPIGSWISLIERNGSPDFREAGALGSMNQPAPRLFSAWTLSLGPPPVRSATRKSPQAVKAARDSLIAAYGPLFEISFKDRLGLDDISADK